MTVLELRYDTSDLVAMIKVVCAAVRDWPQERREAFEAGFDRLVDDRRLLDMHLDGGVLRAEASPEFLALLRRFGIGEVTP
ncbi:MULTISPECIES: hypothetical protein [unclassified Marinovum]|uniref:hypothetical protein n=1 Tax=unclassified Marinovum TaxID=2647166 RepID=UPI003EDBBDE4